MFLFFNKFKMIGVLWDVLHSKTLTKTYMTEKSAELQNQPVPDLDLKIVPGSSRPLNKAGPRSQKNFFRPFGPQVALKKVGGGGGAPRVPPLDPPVLTMI